VIFSAATVREVVTHSNACTTTHARRLIVARHQAGWPQAHIAKAMGISRNCVKKWLDRYQAEGEAGLRDRSSRPRSSPTRTAAVVEQQIINLRHQSRVLARNGTPRLSALDPLTGEVIRTSKATAVRYERENPGELVHMDVKKIGRILDGGGWRVHGRGAAPGSRDRRAKVGYDFVHSLVDDYSRLAYSEVLSDEKGEICAGFLARAIEYFAGHGITNIERLMTDNAWAYRYSLREVCAAHGIRQKFIKPHFPWQNGKVERLNRTLQTEWAYRQVFTSNDERAAALGPWLACYNTRRRHSALGGLPPISRLPPT
jgi:transposase InsO family protein